MKIILAICLMFNVIVGSMAGCITTESYIYDGVRKNPDNQVLKSKVEDKLPKLENFDQLVTMLKERDVFHIRDVLYSGTSKSDMAMMPDDAAPTASMPESEAGKSSSSDSFSKTNNQVDGIDEGDIFKTDGKYLYIISENILKIVDSIPENLKVLAEIKCGDDENISQIFVKDNKLVIIGSRWEAIYGDEKAECTERYCYTPTKAFTFAKVYDITSVETPALIKKYEFEGDAISTREKDGKFYLITNKYINSIPKDGEIKPHDIMPIYRNGAEEICVDVTDVSYCPESENMNFLMAANFDLNGNCSVNTILGSGSIMYMSSDHIYIACGKWKNGSDTEIIKLNLQGETVAIGSVKGHIINQMSMDEYNGNFRIATTTNRHGGETTNGVYVFDENLEQIGKVDSLAPTEQIYSVRFSADVCYMVTFRQMDPLFVINLSDPKNPYVAGELKIPGFSNYLHVIDKNTLIGIGQNVIDTYVKNSDGTEKVVGQRQSGMKISMFDVSDPTNPIEVHTMILGEGCNAYGEILSNHRALMIDKNSGKMGFFYNVFSDSGKSSENFDGFTVVDIDREKGFTELIKKDMTEQKYSYEGYNGRLAYIGNVTYALTNGGIQAYDENYNLLNSIKY